MKTDNESTQQYEDPKRYSIIYADPPWAYLWGTGKDGGNFSPEKHYPTMTTEEICALRVKELRAPNCVLALWTTSPCLPDAFAVLNAWGFKYKTILFVWVKLNPRAGTIVCGPGSYTRSACEYVLLGMRGHIKRVSTKPVSQILLESRGLHSAKPGIVRRHLVELFGDLPRLELFARNRTSGWDVFGNEVRTSIELPLSDPVSETVSPRSSYIRIDRLLRPKVTSTIGGKWSGGGSTLNGFAENASGRHFKFRENDIALYCPETA